MKLIGILFIVLAVSSCSKNYIDAQNVCESYGRGDDDACIQRHKANFDRIDIEKQQKIVLLQKEAAAKQLADYEISQCRSAGFRPNTNEFASCRLKAREMLINTQLQINANNIALLNATRPNPNIIVSPQQSGFLPVSPSINCTSSRSGNYVHTSCN